jgi:hypothetical protein
VVKGDIRDTEDFSRALEGVHSVIHMACVCRSDMPASISAFGGDGRSEQMRSISIPRPS